MDNNTTLVLLVLFVVVIAVVLYALAKNKDLTHNLRIPGASWFFSAASNKKGAKKQATHTQSAKPVASKVDMGKGNNFGGAVEEIAGRDIKTGSSDPSPSSSSVDFGENNTFRQDVKKVAGRDITSTD